jgi:hypothetical protein
MSTLDTCFESATYGTALDSRAGGVHSRQGIEAGRERRRLEILDLALGQGALARSIHTGVIPITTFAPEPYHILRDIPAVVEPAGDGFIATFFDSNISTSGDTEVEAVSNLRSLILDTSDSLGPEPARQLAVLRVFLKRTS